MDEVDVAQRELDHQLAMALGNREQQRETKHSTPSATECIDCDEPIPLARQLAAPGCQRCISCKERFEQLLKHKGK
jgi:phage/conjugal plasmid C-4 type zinc finger TraR family protein